MNKREIAYEINEIYKRTLQTHGIEHDLVTDKSNYSYNGYFYTDVKIQGRYKYRGVIYKISPEPKKYTVSIKKGERKNFSIEDIEQMEMSMKMKVYKIEETMLFAANELIRKKTNLLNPHRYVSRHKFHEDPYEALYKSRTQAKRRRIRRAARTTK